jgi:hypothetical protein
MPSVLVQDGNENVFVSCVMAGVYKKGRLSRGNALSYSSELSANDGYLALDPTS